MLLADRHTRAFLSRVSLARMITKAHTVAGNLEIAEACVLTLPFASEQCCAWSKIVDGVVSLSIKGEEGTGTDVENIPLTELRQFQIKSFSRLG